MIMTAMFSAGRMTGYNAKRVQERSEVCKQIIPFSLTLKAIALHLINIPIYNIYLINDE